MYQPNNPYQNPGAPAVPNWNMPYPNYYQPAQFQYQQNPQMNQPQTVRIPIAGRMVGNVSEIVPNEVPMDGSVSFFPQSDYSCIYAKKWNTDGTIQTVKFVPAVDTDKAQQTSMDDIRQFNTDLANDISNISDRLEKIEKLLTPRTTRSSKEESK